MIGAISSLDGATVVAGVNETWRNAVTFAFCFVLSAGVGRTGAFIVIDSQLERIRHVTTVDIYGQVSGLFNQVMCC
jgi:protein tyrosine phosphatase